MKRLNFCQELTPFHFNTLGITDLKCMDAVFLTVDLSCWMYFVFLFAARPGLSLFFCLMFL